MVGGVGEKMGADGASVQTTEGQCIRPTLQNDEQGKYAYDNKWRDEGLERVPATEATARDLVIHGDWG